MCTLYQEDQGVKKISKNLTHFGHGGWPWPGPDPKGGGGGAPPPPLRTPKLSHGTVCFVGAGGAADFVLGIRRGGIFLFHPMCLYSKYSESCGEFKNGSKAQKGYVATLPTSGPLLILPPALRRRGSPRRQGLSSHF